MHIPLLCHPLSGQYALPSLLSSCPQLRIPPLDGLESCSGCEMTRVLGCICSGREETRQPFWVAHLSSWSLPPHPFFSACNRHLWVPLGLPLDSPPVSEQRAGGPPVRAGQFSVQLPARLSFISGMCCNTRVILTSGLSPLIILSPFSSLLFLPER